MTKRKDKIRQKKQEMILLENIRELPPELIRLIYDYMAGDAKMLCNLKFEYLNYIIEENNPPCSLTLLHINIFISELPKKDVLDLIYKGVLRNYPNILENVWKSFYRRDTQEISNMNGYQIFQLWEKDVLELVVYEDEDEDDLEEKNRKVDAKIIHLISDNITTYIRTTMDIYQYETKKILTEKKWNVSYIPFGIDSMRLKPECHYSLKCLGMLQVEKCKHTLFLTIDKVYHLFKCLDHLMFMRNYTGFKYWREE